MNNMEFKNFVKNLPTKKEEYWKYTNLAELKTKDYKTAVLKISDFDIDFDGYKLFFEDGFFCETKSILPSEINISFSEDGVCIQVTKSLDKPIILINHTNTDNIWHSTKFNLEIAENIYAEFVEYFCFSGSLKADYLNNIKNKIHLQSGARLNHYKIQSESFYANHLANTIVEVEKDAFYNNVTIQTGAKIARNELTVNLIAQGANADFNAVYNVSGKALIDNTVTVNHLSPNTTSNQLVKGVVDGHASGVYQGKISISKDCNSVVGNQQHRGILLSEEAEINVKPELEIFNDDVKCSHGSAIGKLDEDALFYLQSRGLSLQSAKTLLINAFLNEALDKINNIDIKKLILLAI